MKILLVRLRLIGDVVFTTPLVRRAAAGVSGRADRVSRRAARRRRWSSNNPHLDEVIVAPRTRGARRIADDLALARRLRRERFDLALDLHGGPRSAWLTWASGASERIGYDIQGRALDVHADRATARASCGRGTRSSTSGICSRRSRDGPAARRIATRDARRDGARRGRRRADGGAAGGGRAWRADDELVVLHVSAGNPFRRWPEAFFAETAAALAAGNAAAAAGLQLGAVGPRGGVTNRGGRAGAGSGPRAGRIIDLGEFDLQELRALIGRSRLFVGGDTGPLHIAASTAHAGRRHLRPDAVGALGAVASAVDADVLDRDAGRGSALPSVRSADVRARRLPLPDAAAAGRGDRRGGTRRWLA